MDRIKNISWFYLVLLAAPMNVLVNYGYQILTRQSLPLPWVAAGAVTVSAVTLFLYGFLAKKGEIKPLLMGRTPVVIFMMGAGIPFVFICFLTALSTGPISLVDPLWACIYAFVSLFIGMIIIQERPSLMALCGVALYLMGAILMIQGG